MKRIIPVIILLIIVSCKFESETPSKEESTKTEKWTDKKELADIFQRDISEMMTLMNQGDYEDAAAYMPEVLFRYVPKEDMALEFEMMERMGIAFDLIDFEITNISDPVLHDGSYYCRIQTNYSAQVNLVGYTIGERDIVINTYKEQGADISEIEDHSFIVASKAENYAISEEGADIWKYIRFDDEIKRYISNIIPVQVRTMLE